MVMTPDPVCSRPNCGHRLGQHNNLGCHANVAHPALVEYDPSQYASCDCRAFLDEHECLFIEEEEPSGRLVLPPCLVCGTTAMDAIFQMRSDVLAIHRSTQVWTDSYTDEDETEHDVALYAADGELVAATDVRTVCEGCDVRNGVPWPCPTARAVGA